MDDKDFDLKCQVVQVLCGKSKEFSKIGRTTIKSAIDKQPVKGKIKVYFTHLEGNDVEHKPAHGGPERVLLHYALENYDWIKANVPEVNPSYLKAGGFGENIVTRGLTEKNVCIGDVFKIGTAKIQVCQPRMPCYQLNHRFKYKYFSRIMQDARRCGWLYRVIEEGEIEEGCEMYLIERPCPNLSVYVVQGVEIPKIKYKKVLLEEIANCDLLYQEWRDLARTELKNGEVDEDIDRLVGGKLAFRNNSDDYILVQQNHSKAGHIFWILLCLVVILLLQYLPVVQ